MTQTLNNKKDGCIKFNAPLSITHKDLSDCLIGALEGGSNYWYWLPNKDIKDAKEWLEKQIKAGKKERNADVWYSWVDSCLQGYPKGVRIFDYNEFEANIRDLTDEEEENMYKEWELEPCGVFSLKNIKTNLPLLMEKYPRHYNSYFPEYNNGDAVNSDAIFQVLIMGEIVFG